MIETPPVKMWAVVTRQDFICIETIRRTRTESIAKFVERTNHKWTWWKRVYNFRVARVVVSFDIAKGGAQ